MNRKAEEALTRIFLLYVPLVFMLTFIVGPFLWCVSTAFKTQAEVITRPVKLLPGKLNSENIIYVWKSGNFSKFFLNSLEVAVGATILITLVSIMTAYAMTRYSFRGKKITLLVLLCTQFLPHAMMLIPLFMIFKSLNIIDSLACIIVCLVTYQAPYNSVLMTGFMKSIPIEIEEAAMIDGCNRFQMIRHVVLPLLLPGIVACGSFAFVTAWKEFLFSYMFLNTSSKLTVSVGLSTILGEYSVSYQLLAAGCLIAMIPPIILFAYIQKYLVGGLSAGAVKG